jgi:WbqC-like protein family.
LRWSRGYSVAGTKSQRLLSICRAAGATVYVSGPSAHAYLDIDLFAAAGIAVEWMDYGGYPCYPQLFGAFDHEVSVLDLLFNTGAEARHFMKCGAR